MALFFVMVMVTIMGIVLSLIFGPAMNLFWCMLGVMIFSIYIIIDTQMIVGGKNRFQIDEDRYILASVILYLDIINLFLEILRLMGDNK